MPDDEENDIPGRPQEIPTMPPNGREVDLAGCRATVEAADAFVLLPADLVRLVDALRRATLAAIEVAERRGHADSTLAHLDGAWRSVPVQRQPTQRGD